MDIEYTGKSETKRLNIKFGGKASGVTFRVPAGEAPRIVTFAPNATPDQLAGAKAELLATGLYREIAPAPEPTPEPTPQVSPPKPAPKAKEG